LAVPLGLLGSLVWVAHLTLCSFLVRIADRYAEEGKTDQTWKVAVLYPQLILFALTAIPCFFAAYYGSGIVASVLNSLSGTFMTILSTIGGMLPAVGIGMMLMSIFKGKAKIYFFLGFFIAAYFGLGTLPVSLIFLCVALLVTDFKPEDLNVSKAEDTNNTSAKRLSKATLNKAWWRWMYYFQACYNYERMQGIGFLHSMSPVIAELYQDKPDEKIKAMKRHTEFFNTENATGSAVIGLVAAMEEQRANGADLDDESFTNIKAGLMGPLAGVGDTLWQTVMIPMMILMFIGMAKEGNVIAPILYCVLFYVVYNAFGYWLLKLGYNKGSEAILNLMESGVINKVITAAGILGCAVLGGLVSKYVSLSTTITLQESADATMSLQKDFFDAICPGLLPLLLTLGCYKMLMKGMKSYTVMLIIIAIAVVGVLVHIF